MIAAIIVIGLCLNLLVVLTIWAASKGLAETVMQLKFKFAPNSASNKGLLTSGVSVHFELKIVALEDQPAVTVFCPFLVIQKTAAGPSVGKSTFASIKRLATRFAKNIAGSSIGKLADRKSHYLPSVRGFDGCSQSPVLRPLTFTALDRCDSRLSRLAADRLPSPHRLLSQSGKPQPQVRLTGRSKLAVRLERKMSQLQEAIEAACAVSKQAVIDCKLEKLERSLLKKCNKAGKSVLLTILEIGTN